MSKANEIRNLRSDGQTAAQIAAALGVSRSYVYHVLGRGEQATINDVLREIRELRSEFRLYMKQARHPVDRRLERLG